MPTVSVIIPTYNRLGMLQRAIESIKRQTYRDWECIIVDDCSTDGTLDYLRSLGNGFKNLKTPCNSGTSALPRNLGIHAAQGKYIALLDSDDEWMPEYLEKMIGCFESVKDNTGAVYCGVNIVSSKTVYHPHQKGKLYPRMLENTLCAGPPSATIIKRSVFDNVGLFDVRSGDPHWDMWIRMSKCYEFNYIDDALVNYYHHDSNYTINVSLKYYSYIRNKYLQDYAAYPDTSIAADKYIGKIYLERGQRFEYFMLSCHDLNLKESVHLVLNTISPKLDRFISSHYVSLFNRRKPAPLMDLPQGSLSDNDIRCILDSLARTEHIPGDCLEVGSDLGRSSVLIASTIKNDTRLYCVDIWSNEAWEGIAARIGDSSTKYPRRDTDAFIKFWQNMEKYGVSNNVIPMRMSSGEALEVLNPKLRFIFIDGCHEYEYVKQDIEWTQYLVCGGEVIFHDYSEHWPGVMKAASEINRDIYSMVDKGGSCIVFRKENVK
jgi:glycosyltransferase involved in cell wall biosynthesis/predicted O-methyltransferase YrrM